MQTEIYNELQLLKEFVWLAAGKTEDAKMKADATDIIYQIEHIDNPAIYKTWDISIDIFDTDIQNQISGREGIYWRTWNISFDKDIIEIEAISKVYKKNDNDPFEHVNENHFRYNYYLSLKNENETPEKTGLLKDFIDNAKKYESYITEQLNEVSVDIFIA